MSVPGLTFRPATPDDAPFAAPLLYDIARRDVDALFTGLAAGLSPLDIVEKFYRAPGGMFSWRNTELALHDGLPVGLITAYSVASRKGSSAWLARAAGQLGARALVLLAWRGVVVARATAAQPARKLVHRIRRCRPARSSPLASVPLSSRGPSRGPARQDVPVSSWMSTSTTRVPRRCTSGSDSTSCMPSAGRRPPIMVESRRMTMQLRRMSRAEPAAFSAILLQYCMTRSGA